MNKERVKLLIDALRSGEFKQAFGVLRHDDCYCVEGVACEVYRRAAGTGEWDKFNRFNGKAGTMPQFVRNWFGLGIFPVTYQGHAHTLVALNDGVGLGFPVLADLLEEAIRA